jgi:hypothetical protein
LAEGDYFTPDIVFVAKARVSHLSDRGGEVAPDLVVEAHFRVDGASRPRHRAGAISSIRKSAPSR